MKDASVQSENHCDRNISDDTNDDDDNNNDAIWPPCLERDVAHFMQSQKPRDRGLTTIEELLSRL